MIDLKVRSYKKELLDDEDVSFAEIRQNMKELNIVNTLLGGHKITISGVEKITGKNSDHLSLSVCEIGCGGGDNLKAVSDWCKKKNIPATFTGIDIKSACTALASRQYPDFSFSWITNDYAKTDLALKKPAVIFSSLFCHHFTDAELIFMLGWMKTNSGKGFFINDLHRHTIAYFLIKWLTRFFSKSRLVKHDAPLSVARGFKKKDWIILFKAAGINNYSIQWKWAFRYLIVCRNEA